jgi:hypothetical protein
MGLFSSLKNFVTGGGAEVSLELLDAPVRGNDFGVRVTAVVGDADIDIERVYLRVRGAEHVEIPDVEVVKKKAGGSIETEKRTITHQESTFRHDAELVAAMTLKAGETYSWETVVEIPEDVLPTFKGRKARHEWRALAGLDMRGNDPDSGWVDFEID